MPVTIQTQFASAVAEAGQDVFTRSYIEGQKYLSWWLRQEVKG